MNQPKLLHASEPLTAKQLANQTRAVFEGMQRTLVLLNERTTCGAKECSVLCSKEHPIVGCLGTNAKTL